MQKTVSATAIATFEYQGRTYTSGEALTMEVTDALVYAQRRLVSLTKRIPSSQPVPKRRRGSYQRRDLTATRK